MKSMNKHLKALLLIVCVFALPFLGCNTPVVEPDDDDNTGGEVVVPEDTTPATRIIVNPVDFELRPGDTTIRVRISSTADWAITNPCEWCVLSTEGGKAGDTELKISIPDNNEGKTRTTKLTVASVEDNPVTKFISISQDSFFDVTASVTNFEATSEGGEFSTEIISGNKWEIVGVPDWITIKPSEGPKGTCELKLEVAPFKEFGERSAEMTFAGNFDTADTLRVHQTGCFIFETKSPLEYDILAIGDTLTFNVRSNVLFAAEYSDSWLRCDLVEGQPSDKEQTFTLHITKNYTNKRNGYIKLTAAEGDSTIVFNFRQEGSYEFAVGNEFEYFRFTRASNPALSKDIMLTIAGDSIYGYVPDITVDIKALAPGFKLNSNYAKVYVGDVRQANGASKVDFSNPVTYTVVSESGRERNYTVCVQYFTGMPVIFLNTNSGYEISSKEAWEAGSLRLYGGLGGQQISNAAVEMKGVNDNTWEYSNKKRSYEIVLNEATEMLGMPTSRKWTLLSNYTDKTMLRTQVGLALADATNIAWSPDCTPVELVMNGTYRGTYLLCEQIDGVKLGIGTNGHLLKADRCKNTSSLSFTSKFITGSLFGATDYSPLQVIAPTNIVSTQTIEEQFYSAETAICKHGGDWNKVTAVLDVNSIIDQWLVYEITATPDPARGPFNLYLYNKTTTPKYYGGPAWGFNYQSFIPATQSQWVNNSAGWIPYLWNFTEFRSAVKSRWDSYKSRFYKIASIYIDEQAKILEKSAEANWAIHDQNLKDDGRTENGDENLSSSAAIARMKSVLKARLDWLDKQFADWGADANNSGADATIDRIESDNSDKNKENFWN